MVNKTCVITGAYGGFGLELAKKLAPLGYNIVISGRDEPKLNAVSKELRELTEFTAVNSDVTKVRECKKLIDVAVKSYGGIDLMVNNAGVLDYGLKPRLVDKTINANLKGLEYCSYCAISQMKKQENGGVLVNIGSTSGTSIRSKAEEAVYSSSKFGVVAYSASLHMGFKDSKIKVICFCPGGMKTELFRNNADRLLPDFMDPKAAAGVLVKQIVDEKYGLTVLERKGILKYSKDFSLSWTWNHEEPLDLATFK